MSMDRLALRLATTAAVAAAGLALTACSGGGKYTKEGKEQAIQNAANVKAATEFDMAQQAYLGGDLAKASTHINKSIALSDKVAKSFLLKGRIELDGQNFDSALKSFASASELDDENPEIPYFTGLAFERAAKPEQALENYLKATELDPESGQYVIAASEMFIDLEQLDEAKSFLEERSSKFQFNAGVKQTLGHIAMIEGNFADANKLFKEASILAPDDQSIAEDLAIAQTRIGNFAEAEFNLAKLTESKENASRRDLQNLRARCLMELDRPVEAREILMSLTKGTDGEADADSWLQLGHVSYTLGDFARLKQAASRVIALQPKSSDGYILRALWQRSENNLDAALISLAKAVEFRGSDTGPLMLQGLVAQQQGNLNLAQTSYAMVVAENPDNNTASQLLAAINTQLKTQPLATVPASNERDGQ